MNRIFHRLSLGILCGFASLAAAQQQGNREPARCVGKLVGMRPGVLQVETENGERMLIAIEARPQDISFQGTATPAFVQPGMLVQFSATIDKKGEAQDEINQLKVVTPRMGVQIGVQAEGGFSGGELFGSDDSGSKKKRGKNDAAAYTVTGQVRSIRDGKMYVAAGATIKAELADDCQVTFDIADLRFVREGDSVEVSDGWRYANQSSQLYARRLTVTTEKVLDLEEKKRRPTRPDSKANEAKDSKDSEKADAEKESAEKKSDEG